MMEWHQWQTILLISRYGTLVGAANALSVDATTIGRRIKSLEKTLGIKLFIRGDGKLVPTSKCHALLAKIEVADDALHQLVQYTASDNKGNISREVRITAPPFLINNALAPAVGDLTELHRIKVSLFGIDSKALLSRREADIAIRVDDRPGEVKINSPRVKWTFIGNLQYAIYAPEGAEAKQLSWAGLMEPPVMTSGSMAMMELLSDEEIQYQTIQFDSLREIVISAGAKAMLPRLIGDNDKRLVPISDTVLEQPLWMVFHRQDIEIRHFKAARKWITTTMKLNGL